jgi:CBS domain-containing protein
MTRDVVALPRSTALRDAAVRMRDQGIGDVLVVDGDNLVGIVTDRDIAIRAVAESRPPDATTLGDIGSRDLVCVSPSDSIDQAVVVMREAHVRRLPVVEGGRPVGTVSLGDLARAKDPESVLADISDAPPNN